MDSRHTDPTTTKPMAKTKAKTTSAPPTPAPSPAQTQKVKAKAKPQRAKPDPIPPHILAEMAGLINDALERKGWTAYRLARQARVDGAAIHRFLKNKRSVSMATFAKCLDALGLALQAVERDSPNS